MSSYKGVILLTFLLAIVIFAYQYIGMDMHENAHATICRYYGGYIGNKTINIWEGRGQTLCYFNFIDKETMLSHLQADSMVDAFGYQLMSSTMFILLLLGSLIIIIYILKE